jgi:hypothetical protein
MARLRRPYRLLAKSREDRSISFGITAPRLREDALGLGVLFRKHFFSVPLFDCR